MSVSITGLASGIDTAKMIELMMKIERLPYENLQTRKQELTQEQNVIRNINTKLATLRNVAADLMYTASVEMDADKIADKIQKFVDAYNGGVSTIRTNTAKGAILQGDFTLNSLSSRLNELFNGSVGGGGAFRFMFDIGLEIDRGITSGSGMTGTISFDRNKFKEAFAANPDAVMHLFTHD